MRPVDFRVWRLAWHGLRVNRLFLDKRGVLGVWASGVSEDGSYRTAQWDDLDVRVPTFGTWNLADFSRLDELGPAVVGVHAGPDQAMLERRLINTGSHCGRF